MTDDELYNFWLYRDCAAAIAAGDMREQFISAAKALLAATEAAEPVALDALRLARGVLTAVRATTPNPGPKSIGELAMRAIEAIDAALSTTAGRTAE